MFEVLKRAYGMPEGEYRLLIFRYILLVSFGCWLYLNRGKRLKKIPGIVCFIVGIAFQIANQYCGFQPITITYWQDTSWIAVLFVLPVMAVLVSRNLHCRLLELLGQASYEIFLTQMVYYTYGVGDRIIPASTNIILRLFVNIVVCLTVGVIFYKVENPVTRMIGKKLSGAVEKIDLEKAKMKFNKMIKESK